MEGYETVDGIGRSQQQNLRGFVPLVVCSQVLGLVAVIAVAVWMGSFYNGFSWTYDLVFNYHPLFMVIGMIFLYADAILVYRIFRNSKKLSIKILHAVLHILALLFAVIGLKAVFKSHELPGHTNLYSLHSWVGIVAVALFVGQWLIGFVSFLFPKLPEGIRGAIMPFHRNFGVMLFVLSVTAALLGIQEKNGFNSAYKKLLKAELLGNMIGLILIFFASFVVLIVVRTDFRRVEPVDEERIVLND